MSNFCINQPFQSTPESAEMAGSRPLSCNLIGFCEWQVLAFILCKRRFADKNSFLCLFAK
jgi:hypothetical protein